MPCTTISAAINAGVFSTSPSAYACLIRLSSTSSLLPAVSRSSDVAGEDDSGGGSRRSLVRAEEDEEEEGDGIGIVRAIVKRGTGMDVLSFSIPATRTRSSKINVVDSGGGGNCRGECPRNRRGMYQWRFNNIELERVRSRDV